MNATFGKVVICDWDSWIRPNNLTYVLSKYHKDNYLSDIQVMSSSLQGIIVDQVTNGEHSCFILATAINNQPFKFFMVRVADTKLVPTRSLTTQLVTICDKGKQYNYFQDFGRLYGIELTPNSCNKFKMGELCEVLATGWNPTTHDRICIVRSIKTNFITCMDVEGISPVFEVNYEYKSNNIQTDRYFDCVGTCQIMGCCYDIIGAFKGDRFVVKDRNDDILTCVFSECENVLIDTDLSEDEVEQCCNILLETSDKYNNTEYALIRKLCANIKNGRFEVTNGQR